MIALTARYVFPAPQLRVAVWPMLLVAVFFLPLALVVVPVAFLASRGSGETELIERVKRGEITFADAVRHLEARR